MVGDGACAAFTALTGRWDGFPGAALPWPLWSCELCLPAVGCIVFSEEWTDARLGAARGERAQVCRPAGPCGDCWGLSSASRHQLPAVVTCRAAVQASDFVSEPSFIAAGGELEQDMTR
jgi:hypothetical protein